MPWNDLSAHIFRYSFPEDATWGEYSHGNSYEKEDKKWAKNRDLFCKLGSLSFRRVFYGLHNARQKSNKERDAVIRLEAALSGCKRAFYSQVQINAQERVEEERDDKEGLEGREADLEYNEKRVELGLWTPIKVYRVREDGLQLKITYFIQRVKEQKVSCI